MHNSVTAWIISLGSVIIFIAVAVYVYPTTQNPQFITWGNGTVIVPQHPLSREATQEATKREDITVALPAVQALEIQKNEPAIVTGFLRTKSPETQNIPAKLDSLSDLWDLIPSGLLSVTTHTPVRSAFQEALYEYGNAAGQVLESLDTNYGQRQVNIMKDFYSDRSSPQKQRVVIELASALKETGETLENLPSIPESALPLNTRLAHGYIDLGEKLELIPSATSDDALLAAINTYNSSVEEFIGTYSSIANLFSSAGVTFNQTEPGRMFVFTQQAGL